MGAQHNLMAADIVLKLSCGLLLVLVPLTTARALGLPTGGTGLWPRLFGAVLIGLAGAIYAEIRLDTARGLGLVGAVIVNLTAVAVLFALATLSPPATRRGTATLWLAAFGLLGLALGQILAA